MLQKTRLSYQTVADWFLAQAPMPPRKLQKLVYYTQAWGDALLQHPLLGDTHFEAWPNGPVSPELHEKYRAYGWTEIAQGTAPTLEDASVQDLLASVWLTYGDKSANELEALAKQERPWLEARGELDQWAPSTAPISDATMQAFYLSIYAGD
ncbi:Panacea domain-containing protein [Lacticaseibacillus kribbianus]|uniref:Panacea domain-containing protein n=1 Tax=Lacticaseibacillus kribbianus TaxID=2926292 RepID=UPI001CD39D0B|nr:type II toxin-antitoxin system antitoxin SocA domain-containing protein [Lacticaseibacillus kribbianus]